MISAQALTPPPHEPLILVGRQSSIPNLPSMPSRKFLKIRNLAASSSSQYPQINHGDVALRNRMIIDFSNASDLVSARQLFDGMPEQDAVSWNSMMTAYSRNDCCEEVLQLFSEMQRSPIRPNHTSFSTALTSCGKARASVQGRQIHALSVKTQSSANTFVGTSLIAMYSRCDAPDCSIRALGGIDSPSTATWNALISGLVSNRQLSDARDVFDQMPSRNVVSWTAMMSGYAKAKRMRDAIDLFEAMPVRNHVSWSVMIGGFVSCRQFDEALAFFSEMLGSGVRATAASILGAAAACSGTGNLKLGRKIHCYAVKFGFHLDRMIVASLVSMYCGCSEMAEAESEFMKMETKSIGSWNSLLQGYIDRGTGDSIDDARRCFDSMGCRDNLTWNSMISGYLKNDRLDDAVKLLRAMPEPTVEALTALMHSFIKNGNLEEARKTFDVMPGRDVVSYTTLVFGYAEGGRLEDAAKLFGSMPEKNAVTYNVMISGLLRHRRTEEAYDLFTESPVKDAVSWDSMLAGFVRNGLYAEAFRLYKKMALSDARPSELITASLLRASAKLSMLKHGELIHGVAVKLAHESRSLVGNSLINMYGKCGNMPMAELVFDRMDGRDVAAWNAMIHSYACNGLGREAMGMFEKMKEMNVEPDGVTFLCILFACNHSFLLEEARACFDSMSRDYMIEPRAAHYACLVDLQCRMGMAEKARELAHSMPFEIDSCIWTSILSGCRLDCNVGLAEHAARRLLSRDPFDRMPYKHLNDIYVSAGRRGDAERTRSKTSEVASNVVRPGCSWV